MVKSLWLHLARGLFHLSLGCASTSASFPSDTFSCFPTLSQGCESGKHCSASVRHLWMREMLALKELSCLILGTVWQRHTQSEGPNLTLVKIREHSSCSLQLSARSPEHRTRIVVSVMHKPTLGFVFTLLPWHTYEKWFNKYDFPQHAQNRWVWEVKLKCEH